MDVKTAVERAKSYVIELFEEDAVSDIRLEEVEHVEADGIWIITLGFLRSPSMSDHSVEANSLSAALQALSARKRTYRAVRIRESDGEVISVKRRSLTADAA